MTLKGIFKLTGIKEEKLKVKPSPDFIFTGTPIAPIVEPRRRSSRSSYRVLSQWDAIELPEEPEVDIEQIVEDIVIIQPPLNNSNV